METSFIPMTAHLDKYYYFIGKIHFPNKKDKLLPEHFHLTEALHHQLAGKITVMPLYKRLTALLNLYCSTQNNGILKEKQ